MGNPASINIEAIVFEPITLEKFIQELSTKNLIFLRESHGSCSDAHNSRLIIDSLYNLDKTLTIGLEYPENTLLTGKDLCENHKKLSKDYGGNVTYLMKKNSYIDDSDKERDIANRLTLFLIKNKRIIALLGGDHLFFNKGIPSLVPLLSETQAVINQGQSSIIPLNGGVYNIKPTDLSEKRNFYEIIGKINN